MAYIPHDLDLEEGLEVKCKDRLLLFSVFVLVWFPPAEKISMYKFWKEQAIQPIKLGEYGNSLLKEKVAYKGQEELCSVILCRVWDLSHRAGNHIQKFSGSVTHILYTMLLCSLTKSKILKLTQTSPN